MSPADLFAHPEGLPLLLLAPLVWSLLVVRDRFREGYDVRSRTPRRRALPRALFAGGLLLALAATLRPVWGETERAVERRGVDLVVCLDVSRSMWARDVSPDRLTRAKREIRSLAERARGNRMALVVFGGEARVAMPLTRDLRSLAHVADLSDPDTVPGGGTDLGAALETALRLLDGASAGHAAILLLTDGEDLGERGLRVAGLARERGIPVHAVGVGTALGGKIALRGEDGETFLRDQSGAEVVSRMDAAGLRRVAEATGGELVAAAERSDALVGLYEDRVVPMADRAFEAETRGARPDRFQWFLLGAVGLWLLEALLRDRTRPARPVRAAAAAIVAVLAGCGDAGGPSARDLDARAIAALRSGDGALALSSADLAAERGGPAFAARRDFVRGNVAFALSEAAEAEAREGDDGTALDRALLHAEDALASWRMAAASRADWPEARRNVERGLVRLAALREKKRPRREEGPGAEEDGSPRPVPPPVVPPDRPAEPPREIPAAAEIPDLGPEEVARLLEVLGEKEREKAALRRASRPARATGVERDW